MKLYSENEWSTLKEVIIGDVSHFHMRELDDCFLYIYGFLRNFQGKSRVDRRYRILKKYIDERQEDLDALASFLASDGVSVLRTGDYRGERVQTPYFSSVTNSPGCVRDMFLVVGNMLIETPPTDRRRYFEGILLRDIFFNYLRNGARWITAPRPILSNDRIDFKEWNAFENGGFTSIEKMDSGFDIAFDGANCLRFGRDIVMNIGNRNHEWGAHWLQSTLGSEYRVHRVRLTDSHIDGLMVPLEEGTLLMNPKGMKGKEHLLPDFLQKWKKIYVEDEYEDFPYPKDHLQLSSFRGMDTNVLSLGEKRVLIRDTAVKTIKKLSKEGFTPIPFRLRHSELFGGSFHCVTLDTVRE